MVHYDRVDNFDLVFDVAVSAYHRLFDGTLFAYLCSSAYNAVHSNLFSLCENMSTYIYGERTELAT